jgi:hypothetical protein
MVWQLFRGSASVYRRFEDTLTSNLWAFAQELPVAIHGAKAAVCRVATAVFQQLRQ